MIRLSYDRYCAEILAQTEQLAASISGATLSVPVPSCPGWDLGGLLWHVGQGHRWVERIVRTRATEPVSDAALRDLTGHGDDDAAEIAEWLANGAAELATTLREAGPDAPVWTVVEGEGPTFWARRFTHETAMHRCDATLALGVPYTLDTDVALDGLDEWLELGSLPIMLDVHPQQRALLGAGRTLQFIATDADSAWLVDLTGDHLAWRPTREPAAVTVRGPATQLLLLIYGRRPPHGEDVHIEGDTELLTFWLDRVRFG